MKGEGVKLADVDDLRGLPRVDELSRADGLRGFPLRVRVEAARRAIERMRAGVQSVAEDLAVSVANEITKTSLRPAINLSGVILHTGLGRARLAQAAVDAISEVASQHSMLELDPETGKRGDRQLHVRGLLTELTGSEDAIVVNNAASALVLTLNALAKGKEVLLSRGQMVEIGGSFRMPDMVRASGCRLVEVGCTNKTHVDDYETAFGPKTGGLLRCHTSNFQVVGFTEQPSLAELAELAHTHQIPYIDDMGTGCMIDTSKYVIPRMPTIQDSLKAGADIVIASGDKLLGGPQAGLILGRSDLIAKIKKHPLARAVRIDKLSLAALEATLSLYAQGREAEIPTIRYLSRSPGEVRVLAAILAESFPDSQITEGFSEIGGGSAPGVNLPTFRVGLPSKNAGVLARKLRNSNPAIIARIEKGVVWLDPRTLDENEIESVCEVLKSL